jgi:tetraacyldisaccharide 4'-kinase
VRAPEFWRRDGLLPALLSPLALLYGGAGAARQVLTTPWRAPVPVLCIGNLVMGGAGKTPVVIALAALLGAAGRTPHIVSRGYGGRARGVLRVEPARHDAATVGDEALLLARAAPAWVARDRAAGIRAAAAAGADLVLLDDGFQNPSVAKDFSLLVVDGAYGFGNRRLAPAGPLREGLARGLARAQGIVLIGADERGIAAALPPALPVLRARLSPIASDDLRGRRVFAIAGIGRPEKFRRTLQELGAVLAGHRDFPDHHPYTEAEIADALAAAKAAEALPVTTAKDHVRLPLRFADAVRAVAVEVVWHDQAPLQALLASALRPLDAADPARALRLRSG